MYDNSMIKYKYWQDSNDWVGYLVDFPDYITQGTSLEDLKEHLTDLFKDLTSGQIPYVRRVGELDVS